jgi:hypothetical protein
VTFLNSALLFLLSAVSIPLIIHFLSKRRIKTIEFSSLKFLEQMQRSRMRWLKIKELILLLLRMLVIALIVMAFARPTLRGFAGASRAKSSVAIIIDRSASMDAEGETGSLFEEAKRLAAKLIQSFDPGDQITLISYPGEGAPDVFGPTNPGEKLIVRLQDIEIGYQKGNIGEALLKAREVLSNSPDLNQEIYIFSDLQSENFKNLPKGLLDKALWQKIHLFTISPKPTGGDNIGISDVLLPPQLLVPGENFDVEAELTNYGLGHIENVLVGVVVDGERKAQATVSLPSRQPTKVRFSMKLDSPGNHGGYVEIDHDSFEPDNKRYLSLQIPDKINLLVVGQMSAGDDVAKLVLDRPEAGQVSYAGIGAADLLREDLGKYDVIFLNDISSLDASRESAISRFVSGGGGLFVALGRISDPAYWGKFLSNLAGISSGVVSGKNGEYLTWSNFDYEHPIFSIYSPDPLNKTMPSIPELKVVFYHNLEGGHILGSTSNGTNLLSESANGSVLVLSCGLDLASSDLPAHSFIIPLLMRSIEYLGSHKVGGGDNGIIGEMTQWRFPENITTGLSLFSPSNKVEDLQPHPEGTGSATRITEYGVPGIYTLKKDDKPVGLLAFNIDNTESASDILSTNEIAERLGIEIRAISPESDLKAAVLQARFGRELWKEFLLLALVLLIAESMLGRTSPPKLEGK